MSDLKMFKSTLEESKYSLNVIEQLLLASINLTNGSNIQLPLTDRIKHVKDAEEVLSNNEDLSKLSVYKSLMTEQLRLTAVLKSNCVETWRKQISWLENETDSQESWKVMLKISGSQEEICDSILALQNFDCLSTEIKLFSLKLMNLILNPIIVQNLQVDLTESVHVSTMTLKVSHNENQFLSTIIKNLKIALEFLNSTLPVGINETRIMSDLGYFISQPFCEIFKEVAIFNAVPETYSQLDCFREELKEVLEFDTYLSKIGNFNNTFLYILVYIY